MLVVFEGMDGSGKTTTVGVVNSILEDLAYKTIILREPSSGPHGVKFRQLSSKVLDSCYANELLIQDRAWDVAKNVTPALKSNKIVLMDRYFYSHVYQCEDVQMARMLIARNRRKFPIPDLTFVFDVSPYEARRRIHKFRARVDHLETTMPRIRGLYRQLFSDISAIRINGHKPVAENAEGIARRILGHFERNKSHV